MAVHHRIPLTLCIWLLLLVASTLGASHNHLGRSATATLSRNPSAWKKTSVKDLKNSFDTTTTTTAITNTAR
jgi:hypothetical protein